MGKSQANLLKSSHQLNSSSNWLEQIITISSDMAILIDHVGTIIETYVNKSLSLKSDISGWANQDIRNFLTFESIEKLENLLKITNLKKLESSRAIELNHVDEQKWEFPIAYRIKPLSNERILLIGRDLRPVAEIQQQLINAQLSIEKEYEKYRGYDTRLRVLLENSKESFVFIDAKTGQILDGNQSAARLIGLDLTRLINIDFNILFKNQPKDDFLMGLKSGSSTTQTDNTSYVLKNKNIELNITPVLFRANTDILILCKLEEITSTVTKSGEMASILESFYFNNSDGIVFVDGSSSVRYANEAFLSMCDIADISDIYSKSLGDFLVRGSVDAKVLLENTVSNGSIQLYQTKLQTSFGRQILVEISTTYLGKKETPSIGLIFKDISRSEPERHQTDNVSAKSVQNVMKLVGSAPLKELVADTNDVVERLCIETAIELTGNNRVAAADMLGVSRQSLYVKLRKYGLMSKDGETVN